MAITANIVVTPYAQTALVYISYNLNGYSGSNVIFDLRVERPDIWGTAGTLNVAVQRSRIILDNTGDGSIAFPFYPLPANTSVKMLLYIRDGSSYSKIAETTFNTQRINTNAVYLDMPIVTSQTPAGWEKISETDKQTNARIFYETLSADGWSDQAIASILAFAEHYGDVNPNSNLKYLMPWALDRKPYSPWTDYLGGQTYQYNSPYNLDQFGGYWHYNSGDNSEVLTPPQVPYSNFLGGALNAFIQENYSMYMSRPTGLWGRVSAFQTFLPVYKQHYIDILDKYLGYHWYESTQAFTIEQYLQYLKYYRTDNDSKLSLISENSELENFNAFTISIDEASILVLKLYRSLNKTEMYPFDQYGSYAGYVPRYDKDVNNAEYWLPKYAIKWYDYIQTIKPKPSKRRKMQIWEYLRYTI